MREQSGGSKRIARQNDDLANIGLSEREQHRPRRSSRSYNHGSFTDQRNIGYRPVKSASIAVRAGQHTRVITERHVDCANRVADLTGVGNKIECCNLVRNRNVTPTPCRVFAPFGKIPSQSLRGYIGCLIACDNTKPVEPELVDKRRFAVANRVADNFCIWDHDGNFALTRK